MQSTQMLYPMTLYETGEANGSVSISELLQDKSYDIDGRTTDLELEDKRNPEWVRSLLWSYAIS